VSGRRLATSTTPLIGWKSAAERAQSRALHRGGPALPASAGALTWQAAKQVSSVIPIKERLLGCQANSTAAPGVVQGLAANRRQHGGQGGSAAGNVIDANARIRPLGGEGLAVPANCSPIHTAKHRPPVQG